MSWVLALNFDLTEEDEYDGYASHFPSFPRIRSLIIILRRILTGIAQAVSIDGSPHPINIRLNFGFTPDTFNNHIEHAVELVEQFGQELPAMFGGNIRTRREVSAEIYFFVYFIEINF